MFEKPCFAIDYNNNYYVGMSFNCIIEKDSRYKLEYVLGILNSNFAYNWFYKNGKKRGAGVDIGVDKLRTFPIKQTTQDNMNKIIDIVKQLQNNYSEQLESELNRIIDDLYK